MNKLKGKEKSIMNLSPTERFSSRVEAYIKYRPSYPTQIINYLKSEAGLLPNHIVADIGSGTGFLSQLFLGNGNTVYGIEPNNPMRQAAEKYLNNYKNFISRPGRAEQTFLEDGSVDFITAGQAFHWFEPEPTKNEFLRIARSGAKLVLVWNRRNIDNDSFQKVYEEILRTNIPEYQKVDHRNIDDEKIKDFVSPFDLQKKSFHHFQTFNYDMLIGHLLSASYCPDEKSASFKKIVQLLTDLFDKHAVDGKIKFNYKAEVYWAKLK